MRISDLAERIEPARRIDQNCIICKTEWYDSNLENEIWFNSHIDLNHGLVAIIGNKGSGKSALLDVIGLLSGYNKEEFFSFLHKKRFRDPKKGKAKHFSATLLWKSGISESSSLDTISTGYSQNVRYIPQHFFEEICNDTEIRQDSKFNEELESVIFSHVDHHERLGYGDLKSLIVYKTEEINKSIANLNASLTIINSQIVDLENQLMPSYKEEQEEYLRKKREELAIHEQNKPITIEKPEDNSDISNEIDKLRLEQEQIKVNKTLLEDRRESLYRKITITQKIINEIDLFRSQYENFVRQINEHIDLIQKDINEVVEVKISKDVITSLQADTQLEIDTLGKEIEVIDLRIIQIDESIKVKKSKLEQTHQSYQKYLSDLTIWETRRLEIIGDQGTSNTISWYEERINEIDAVIPQKLQQRKDQRNIIISDIYHQKNKIKEVYMNLYHPVQKFIDEHPLVKDVYKLSFEVSLKVIPSFFDSFFQHIKRNAGGTFHGSEDGMQYLKDLVAQYDFDTEQDISNFINQIITSLEINQRSNQKVTNFAHQLRSTVVDFYNFIYGLSYIEPDYALTLDNKKLHQLSPGERGILLLIFYLLIDNNDCPLIIDQPEENIDNQSIYKLLVPCIKIAKNRRQILLVTHNPNLAVVCDAEQIIFAYMSKDSGNEIQYLCGSIENPGINPILVDVLEGTWPALSKRESMYHKT